MLTKDQVVEQLKKKGYNVKNVSGIIQVYYPQGITNCSEYIDKVRDEIKNLDFKGSWGCKYQFNPEEVVDCGIWNVIGRTADKTAIGANKQGVFYRGYYAVDGTNIPNNGKGTFNGIQMGLSFGGEFPTPSATGCEFIGWNSKPDGSGIYYSADGSNIGYDAITDEVLVLADITGSFDYGQEITLYAIWADLADGTTLDDTNTDNISKTYTVTELYNATGVFVSNGMPIATTSTITTSDVNNTVWSNEVFIKTDAQFQATGVYAIDQHLFTLDGKRINSIDYYVAGAKANSVYEYIYNTFGIATSVAEKPIWIRNGDEHTIMITNSGTTALTPDDLYNVDEKGLNVNYDIQGSFTVYGTSISRTYASNEITTIGQAGYPGFTTTQELTLKIDKTIPIINHYSVKQDSLNI